MAPIINISSPPLVLFLLHYSVEHSDILRVEAEMERRVKEHKDFERHWLNQFLAAELDRKNNIFLSLAMVPL